MSGKAKRQFKSGIIYRTFEVNRAAMKEDSRSVELSFSSELPVEQYNWEIGRYYEVLDHKPDSVDLTRLNNGGPLLMDHNREDQVGVIESAEIKESRGTAVVRFGNSTRASEIFQDVKDGIRRLVSVGYRVHKLVTEKIENEVETLRAMRWTPMEISIVSIPADASVGIGREDKTIPQTTIEIEDPMKIRSQLLLDPAPATGGGGPATPPAPAAPAIIASRADIAGEFNEMFALCKRHNKTEIYEQALRDGWSPDRLRKELLTKLESLPIEGRAVIDPSSNGDRTRDGQTRAFSIGERLVNSELFRSAAKSNSKSKNIALEIDNVLGMRDIMGDGHTRATLLSTGMTSYDRPPGITVVNQQPLTIAQLLAQGETTASTIRIFTESSFTNAATAVAEEGEKPEATFSLAETDFAVKKIAVIGRISDEMLSDYPAVRDYVNARLGFMVQAKEDNELLNGAGGSSITGILQTGSIQTQAYAGNTIFDAIDKGLQKVRTIAFLEPDAIIMNPTDWGNARRSKDSNGQYYAGGPFSGTYGVGGYSVAGFLWGKPVIETTAIAQGTALVGAFRLGAQLFRRMGLTMEMTNSDASDFKYNRIAIRAEERLALVVYRAASFCTVTGIPNV